MLLPRRRLAALLVLLTLALSFTEAVWASTCADAMAMDASPAQMADMAGMDPTGGRDAPRDGSAPAPLPDDTDRAGCPIAGLVVTGGCHVAAYPGAERLALDLSAEPAVPAFARDDESYRSLLARTPFHPPKA